MLIILILALVRGSIKAYVLQEKLNLMRNRTDVYGVAIAAANAWGLLLVVVLLGYALPEIPKKIWRDANYEKTLKFYNFEAVNLRTELDSAKKELDTVMKVIYEFFKILRK
jgi:hypothetical protein